MSCWAHCAPRSRCSITGSRRHRRSFIAYNKQLEARAAYRRAAAPTWARRSLIALRGARLSPAPTAKPRARRPRRSSFSDTSSARGCRRCDQQAARPRPPHRPPSRARESRDAPARRDRVPPRRAPRANARGTAAPWRLSRRAPGTRCRRDAPARCGKSVPTRCHSSREAPRRGGVEQARDRLDRAGLAMRAGEPPRRPRRLRDRPRSARLAEVNRRHCPPAAIVAAYRSSSFQRRSRRRRIGVRDAAKRASIQRSVRRFSPGPMARAEDHVAKLLLHLLHLRHAPARTLPH